MIRLSGEGACSTRPVVGSVTWTGVLPANPINAAPPATATLNDATTASRTMLQFSSRILMPEKRGREGVVPRGATRGRRTPVTGGRAPVRTETKIQKEWCPIEAASGHAFD